MATYQFGANDLSDKRNAVDMTAGLTNVLIEKKIFFAAGSDKPAIVYDIRGFGAPGTTYDAFATVGSEYLDLTNGDLYVGVGSAFNALLTDDWTKASP